MRAAAEAGLAPPVLYADPDAGVAIITFVESRPLDDYPGGPEALARALGSLAARLQATQLFPPVADYPSLVGGLLERLQATRLYRGLLDPHRDAFERLRAAYPWDSFRLVSSHNDPHPGNILFDGERLWLIDWETAFRNDPAVDLALMTMYRAARPTCRRRCSRRGAGAPPTPSCGPGSF